MGSRLKWRGKVAEEVAIRRLSNALVDIGLDVEGEGKLQLYKGHGVITGTLRRSVHSAPPSYNWFGDNVPPSDSSPERGGQASTPERIRNRLFIAVGSGLEYALVVHQGGELFEGYHFITIAIEKVRPRVKDHVRRHKNDP